MPSLPARAKRMGRNAFRPVRPDRPQRWKTALTSRSLWIVILLLAATTLLHYLTPQTRLLPPPLNVLLSRHAVERILFIFPVLVATYAFRWQGGALTLVVVVLAMLPRAIWVSPYSGDALLEVAATTALGALVIWVVEAYARATALHQTTASENARLYASIRFYARQVVQVEEEERARIARELHDETIQTLTAISRRLELFVAALPEPLPLAAGQRLETLQDSIRSAQKDLRRLVQGLRPPTLDHLGLVAASRGLIGELRADGFTTDLDVTGEVRRLHPERELALFRIAQEALSNVRRHAGASRVAVRLEFQPDRVQMSIEDDGCGFSVPTRIERFVDGGGLGLIGMNERAQSLGGTLSIHSAPGQGTVVTADLPEARGLQNTDRLSGTT